MAGFGAWRRAARVWLVVATVLAGCTDASRGAPGTGDASATNEGALVPVRTVPPGLNACAGVLYDPVPIILTAEGRDVVARLPNGETVLIYWPPGTQAVFDPEFSRIVDEDQQTVAPAGTNIRPFLDDRWLGWNVCTTVDSIFFY